MEGRSAGDSFSVSVSPEEGYGERDESLVQVIPRSVFKGVEDLEVGLEVQIEDEEGTRLTVISNIDEDSVTLDGNHHFAGMKLNFEVNIIDVREATEEELEGSIAGGWQDGNGCECCECDDNGCN